MVLCGTVLAGVSQAAPLRDPAGLASSPAWLKLLHYEPVSDGHHASRVIEPGFFVSPSGQTDPLAELNAFIAALRQPNLAVGYLKQPAVCAFPARARLVRSALGIKPVDVPCPDFEQWRERLAARSVTLVFASAYANNPASLFGHTLLRLNTFPASAEPTLAARELLNYSVSFLAQTDPTDNVLSYTYKGLFGGYIGTYNIDPYYMSVAIYNDAEDRDLWEYDLDLPPAVLTMLVEHVWELSNNARVTYFFANENCSFQIMAMLEAVMPELDLTADDAVFVLPLDTVRTAIAAGLQPKRIRRRPALGAAMQSAVAMLGDDDRTTFEALAVQDNAVLEQTHSVAAMDAAVACWNYRKFAAAGKLLPEESAWLRALLLKRASMGAGRDDIGFPQAETLAVGALIRPDEGHATASAQVYAGRFDASAYSGFAARAGLHDLMSDARGYDGSAAITYFDLDLRGVRRQNEKTKVQLERLTIAEVVSIAPYTSLVPRWSWRLGGGARRPREYTSVDGLAPLTVGADMAGGVAAAPFEGSLFYLLAAYAHDVSGRLPQGFRAAPGFDAGWLLRLNGYRMMVDGRWRRTLGEGSHPFGVVAWRHAFNIGINDELRLEFDWFTAQRQTVRGWQAGYLVHF